MKTLIIGLFGMSILLAQTTVCDKGIVNLLIKANQSEDCYKNLKIEKTYKYRFCDSGIGFLYNDGDSYPERLFFDNDKWNWRIDTLDYTNNISSTSIMDIDKNLTQFTYTFVEKTYKGHELRRFKCEGEFQKR